jgi:hypothetical protein
MYDKIENSTGTLADGFYERAQRRAFWRKIRSLLGQKCNDLLPAEHVLNNLLNQEFRTLGLQQVPIERIVGSSGRYHDFDLEFLPLRQEHNGRWQSIARARHQGINLPPPLLYQVGDVYFVEDGNHRISVAIARGEEHIAANVIAIDTSTLKAESSCTRLGYKIADSEPQNEAASCSA